MAQEHHLTFGPFRLDPTQGRVWLGAEVATVRPRSLALLRYLVEHPGRLVTKAEIRQHVWAGTHVTDTVLRGWALAIQGDAAEGVVQIRQALAVYQRIGSRLGQPYYLALLAEAYGQAGQPETGLQALTAALTLVAETEEHWWEAEVHRLTGALLLQRPIPDTSQAEGCFRQALAVARRQRARSLELRAAISLSRLWQQQGQRDAARDLLAPIYGWFTEGFDTPDLREATALLDAL